MLLLGGQDQAAHASTFDKLRVTRVVNCTVDLPHYFAPGSAKRSMDTPADLQYLRVPVEDRSTADLGPHFEAAADFIHEALGEGRRVLVHCAQGLSRSVAIVYAYLVLRHGCRLELADAASMSAAAAPAGSGAGSGGVAAAAGAPSSTGSGSAGQLFIGGGVRTASAALDVGRGPAVRLSGPHDVSDYRQHGAAGRPNRGFVQQLLELCARSAAAASAAAVATPSDGASGAAPGGGNGGAAESEGLAASVAAEHARAISESSVAASAVSATSSSGGSAATRSDSSKSDTRMASPGVGSPSASASRGVFFLAGARPAPSSSSAAAFLSSPAPSAAPAPRH
jgi:hypothetical protein